MNQHYSELHWPCIEKMLQNHLNRGAGGSDQTIFCFTFFMIYNLKQYMFLNFALKFWDLYYGFIWFFKSNYYACLDFLIFLILSITIFCSTYIFIFSCFHNSISTYFPNKEICSMKLLTCFFCSNKYWCTNG